MGMKTEEYCPFEGAGKVRQVKAWQGRGGENQRGKDLFSQTPLSSWSFYILHSVCFISLSIIACYFGNFGHSPVAQKHTYSDNHFYTNACANLFDPTPLPVVHVTKVVHKKVAWLFTAIQNTAHYCFSLSCPRLSGASVGGRKSKQALFCSLLSRTVAGCTSWKIQWRGFANAGGALWMKHDKVAC